MKPLFAHQHVTVQRLLESDRLLDTSDPGTGKTRCQIEAISRRQQEQGAKCALIIAPKSLLVSAWQDDFASFAPHVRTQVCTATNREKAFAQPADVYITNTDAANWLAKQPKSFFDRFDTLVIDESSYFKHHTSQRSKSINKIKRYFKYRYAMTGTPNANSITDLWHQVFILDDGQRLGKSFFQFRGAVCSPQQVGPQPNMVKWTDRPEAIGAVGHLIGDITVRHKFEECHDIPPNFLTSVKYHLSDSQRRAYSRMEADAVVSLQGKTVTAVNAASVMTKLLQIASGAVYDEAANTESYALVDTGRAELVGDLVQARDHSIVFFNWKHQRDELEKEFQKRGIMYAVIDGTVSSNKRAEIVRGYQDGYYQALLAHPQSAAHGLTLTRGTTTIWASPTHNLEHFLQGNRRVYRAGQKQKTETIVILADGTIEDKVYKRLTDKEAKQSDMLNILQELHNDRLGS